MRSSQAEPINPGEGGQSSAPPPVRLGFLGLGWIGLSRMRAVQDHPAAVIAALADPSPEGRQAAREIAPAARCVSTLDELLAEELDGVVIATPSALHAEQASIALRAGCAVYCQKPLGRTADETSRVVETAREADRLLGVDYCYRHVDGVSRMRELVQSGSIGRLFAIDLTFHNAYGPDKPWFYDRQHSGGGCLIDLGTHLVDLAFWICGSPRVGDVQARLFHKGVPLRETDAPHVEDAAFAQWTFDERTVARLACSWNLSAGCDARIAATFYGDKGAVSLQNIDGSFYRFSVAHNVKTEAHGLATSSDTWGGRSLGSWIDRLAADRTFSTEAEESIRTASLIDAIYDQ